MRRLVFGAALLGPLMRKFLAWFAVVVVLAGGAAFAGWTYWGPTQAAVEPPTVFVERGDVEQTVLASGALQANAVTSLGAEVSGRIQTLSVRLGDVVKKGDPIAEIDSVNQQNAVKSAEASLANMRAQLSAKQADLKTAQAALERADKLRLQNLLSDADLLTAQAALASAEAAIASLEAQVSQSELAVESARLDLERTNITAPVGGTIVAVLVTEGQSVNAAQSAPTIVKIADLDTMLIKAQISEADITRVRPGQNATFTVLGDPKTRINATLLSVEPAPDAIATSDTGLSTSDNAVYYNGIFSVANPDHALRIAMTTQVTIVIDERKGVLTLPASALGTAGRDGLYRVGVFDPATSKVRVAEVKAGLNNNITAEILEGLAEGDRVVAGANVLGAVRPGGTGGQGGMRMGGLGGGGQVFIRN
jgi:macrolide-specific efflux system membrane fusion protein